MLLPLLLLLLLITNYSFLRPGKHLCRWNGTCFSVFGPTISFKEHEKSKVDFFFSLIWEVTILVCKALVFLLSLIDYLLCVKFVLHLAFDCFSSTIGRLRARSPKFTKNNSLHFLILMSILLPRLSINWSIYKFSVEKKIKLNWRTNRSENPSLCQPTKFQILWPSSALQLVLD